MMVFVNRSDELAALRAWWSRPPGRMALVWGRRRVGKTALLQRFSESVGAPVVFHTGTGERPAAEIAALCRQIATAIPDQDRDLAARPYEDWRDVLDHLARLARDAPVLVVLDEFPELIAGSPALPGILRAFLDQTEGRTQLRVVLSGSAMRTIEAMREYRAPLYGRFDLTLLLHPFRPHEAAAMLGELTPAERALVYGIVGGTPLYLSWWNPHATLAANLLDLAGRAGAPLLTEGRLVMATEAGPGDQSGAVLRAIAAGKTRYGEIMDAVGAEPSRALDRLAELRIIERLLPVTEQAARTRRKIYRMTDNYLAFYLGPLARYRAEIERGLGSSIMPALIRRLDDFMGPVYEEAFREHLRRMARDGALGADVVAIGPWWRDDGQDQIDALVLAQPDHAAAPVLAGEAKWARSVDARRLVADLMRKVLHLGADSAGLRYCVCARDEVTNADPGVLALTAGDIFAA